MHPGEPLFTAPKPSTEPELERREHFFQRAACSAKDDASADLNDSNAELCSMRSFAFPGLTDLAHKAAARCRGFVELFVSSIAIESNGRAADKNCGLTISRPQSVYHIPCCD